jgi:hypothetical protein
MNVYFHLCNFLPRMILQINQSSVSNFSLGEMSLGSVVYENGAVTDVGRDGFRYEAVVEEAVSSPNDFDISIYPEAYWTPLTVNNNEEGAIK